MKPRKRTLTVELTIREYDDGDAAHVVDEILDSGVFQAAINEFESDDGEVEVLSALIRKVK